MNKIKKISKFLISPRDYINTLVNERYQQKVDKMLEQEFFYPINYTLQGDIFIAGYPRSGNTWTQSLISGLLFGIETQFLSDKLAQEIVPDVHARKYYKRFGKINFFKTHDLPQKFHRKVIYIVRDGRDAMTSYYFFNKNLGNDFTLDEMVREGVGIVPSKWYYHAMKWIENPHDAEIIYIRYEDLILNPEKELKRICDFAQLDRSLEIIRRTIDGNKFELMKIKSQQYGGVGHKDWLGEKGEKFFRKGKIGDYKNHFTNQLIEFFNNEAKKELTHFNYL